MNPSVIRNAVLVTFLSFLTVSIAEAQTTIYVDDIPNPNGDGTSGNPFDTIQQAVNAAMQGDTVMVRDGTYTGNGNRNISVSGVAITIQSENGAANAIVDCELSDVPGFRIFSFGIIATDPQATVIGLTVTRCGESGFVVQTSAPTIDSCIVTNNGLASNGSVTSRGGGIDLFQSPAIIRNCTITGNRASNAGGGIACNMQSPTIEGCVISGNNAPFGGGIELYSAPALIRNCTISGNTSSGGFVNFGGGIYSLDTVLKPTLIDGCMISGNMAGEGGGIFFDASSGISFAEIKNSTIAENQALVSLSGFGGLGGGISTNPNFVAFVDLQMFNTKIVDNTAGFEGGGMNLFNTALGSTIANCIVSGNKTGSMFGAEGGGLHISSPQGLAIVNTTFFSNTARAVNGGGGLRVFTGGTTLTNCIFWDNMANGVLHQINSSAANQLTISFTDVQGGQSGINSCTGSCWGAGNIDADPDFVNRLGMDGLPGTLDDDLRVMLASPVIDIANNSAVPNDITDLDEDGITNEVTPIDLGGTFRICDALGGGPVSDTVDMGAFEICNDCDGNQILDDDEIAADPTLDCNGTGILDICECPAANIDLVNSSPPDGILDARQPHKIDDSSLWAYKELVIQNYQT